MLNRNLYKVGGRGFEPLHSVPDLPPLRVPLSFRYTDLILSYWKVKYKVSVGRLDNVPDNP